MYTHYVILSQPSIIEPLKSLRTNSTSCEMTCTQNNGRIPYLYEAKSVLTQLDKNSTINGTDFSLIAEHLPVMRRSSFSPKNVRQLQFRISASFNFENDIWRSGGFQIQENNWAENKQKFPILNDRLNLVHQPAMGADHFGAVYCGDQLGEKDFKVRSRLNFLTVKRVIWNFINF